MTETSMLLIKVKLRYVIIKVNVRKLIPDVEVKSEPRFVFHDKIIQKCSRKTRKGKKRKKNSETSADGFHNLWGVE